MLDLILIIMLIISLSKPDVLLSKKLREKATDEQKAILIPNLRKIYGILIATFESLALTRYIETSGLIISIVCLVLLFKIALPASKENKEIIKQINSQE